jgi:hypothetical protein
MRHAPVPTLSVALLATLLAGCAADGRAPRADAASAPPPRAGECFDPAFARSWHFVDDDELLVDAGRRKFRIRLAEMCFSLGTSPALVFRGDYVSNRVCGGVGEYVVVGRDRCRIQSVERIDDETYRALSGDRPARTGVQAVDDE